MLILGSKILDNFLGVLKTFLFILYFEKSRMAHRNFPPEIPSNEIFLFFYFPFRLQFLIYKFLEVVSHYIQLSSLKKARVANS
jgi:hypothetical protein